MPKSKRDRQVTLSKTKKKGREHKETIVNTIRQAAEDYSSAYVFSFENMRNHKFKEFREQLKSNSRFFLGSNKVMQIALGRSESDEIRPGLHKISKVLHGDAGLCFTNLPKEEVERLFNEYEEYDFARTGSISTEKVELKEGPLEQFSHEMEPFLRKQGMPVRLNKGVIELVSDFLSGMKESLCASHAIRTAGFDFSTLYKYGLNKLLCSTKSKKIREFSTSVYREAMAQRLAEIDVEIQNVENAIHDTRRMLNLIWRHLRSANPAAIEARMEASRQRIRELEERLQGLRQEQQALIVRAVTLGDH